MACDDECGADAPKRQNIFFRHGEPVWSPAPVVYMIVWTLLYIGIAYVAWRAWDEPVVSRGLVIANILANLAWIPVFLFLGPLPGLAVLILAVLLALALASQLQRISTPRRLPAQIFWYVYIAWLVFATVLNAQIVVGAVRRK